MEKKSFVRGAAVLASAGLFAKFLGAIFRIPLTYVIGPEGMGLYQMAYPIYSFLLVMSSAGLPVAISKMVSERIALNDYTGAHRVFRISLALMAGIGIFTSVLLFSFSGVVARAVGNVDAVYSIMAIAPGLFFVAMISSFRGYFQGMQHMTPTALSQVVEQTIKLAMGLLLASHWVKWGVQYGAAGAMLGVTLSEVAALILLLGIYRHKRAENREKNKQSRPGRYREPTRGIMARMLSIAIPVTIGASIMPLVALVDEMVVVNRLVNIINYDTGFLYTVEEATSLYGLLTAYAGPLINFPTIITIALAMSIVPSISESYVLEERRAISAKTETALRLTLLLGLPAGVGMCTLARPIIQLLYASLDVTEVVKAGSILSVLSIGVVFLTAIQALTGILQGIDQVAVPVRNLFIGAMAKVVVSYILIGIPEVNILGAAIGTVICYLTAALLDFAAVVKYIGVSRTFGLMAAKLAFAAAFMGAVVVIVFKPLMAALGHVRATMLTIFIGAIVYALLLIIMGAVDKRDLQALFRNSKLANRMVSARLRNE